VLGLLSLIPHRIKHGSHVGVAGVGVAGWNTSAAGPNVYASVCVCELGTLLGPEETPVGVVLGHSWLGRLTQPVLPLFVGGGGPLVGVVGVVAVVGWGVVVC
jgi:predicted Na+-dependent transporter